jgi:phosphoglycolate phosphatase-like HAD superfamily hydrolase
MKPVILWDLDGTLFDCNHRLRHILGEKPDWRLFHQLTPFDRPLLPAVMMYKALLSYRYEGHFTQSFILTGRSDLYIGCTKDQLEQHALEYHALYMRPHGHEVSSAQLKSEFVDEIVAAGYTPVLAFEDEPRTVAMYRERDIHVFAADDRNWRAGKYREVKPT